MSRATHPITWCHIPEDLIPQVSLFCIQEFLSSHLNPQTSHPDRIFVIFQAFPWKLQDGTKKICHNCFLSHNSFINLTVSLDAIQDHSVNWDSVGFHSRTVHLDIIKVSSPTDAKENCFKRSIKIYIKTAPTCFTVITIIRERTIWAC